MQGVLKPFEVRDRRVKEKFDIDDVYLNGWAKKCGIYATGIYISLCRHANKEQYCWPSQKKIAEELAISRDKVIEALQILEKHNIIVKERLGKKANNRYWLTDKSEWTDSPISDVANNDITCRPQRHHHVANSDIHSKVSHSKDTHIRFTADAEKKMNTHNDNDFSDSGDPVIQEGEEIPTPKAHARQRLIKAKGYDPALTNELLQWAIDHTGQRYSHPLKQKAHIATMLAAGRTQEQIVEKWLELEQDDYWSGKGIDFSIVASQIDKTQGAPKIVKI